VRRIRPISPFSGGGFPASTVQAGGATSMKTRSARLLASLVVASASLVAVACSSGGDGADGRGGRNAGADSEGFGSSGGTPAGGDIGEACAASVAPYEMTKRVDIVFVVDHSASMHDEMAQIRDNVNRFAERIDEHGLDARVVFVVPKDSNLRYAGICVPPPLGAADCGDNPPRFFHVDQPVGSRNALELILATYEHASVDFLGNGGSGGPGWKIRLREDAIKVFVVVTDDESRMSAAAFDKALLAKQPAGMFGTARHRKYVFHSIVSKPKAATAPTAEICETAAGSSIEYQKLSLLTGGVIDEVCETDYTPVLDSLAEGVRAKVSCEIPYPSSEESDPSRLAVRFTAAGEAAVTLTQVTAAIKCREVADGWYYDNPENPGRIILCPGACDTANATMGSKLEALVGCKAPPPR
jgi:hypothetical protein